MIQTPTDALRTAVEAVREVSVAAQVRVQVPPHVDHLITSIDSGFEYTLKCGGLFLGVAWRLVPVWLRIREVESRRRDVYVAGPDYGLLRVQRVDIRVEVFIPSLFLGHGLH